MTAVTVIEGDGPLFLAQPHSGVHVPDDILATLNPLGRELRDTDWHIPTLYDGLAPNASIVRAEFSRYVIDPNRDPNGSSLYPGQNTTDLVPLTTFDGAPIWTHEPSAAEVERRTATFHAAYHDALRREIDRVKTVYGFAILYDCHSIRSVVPHLFEGRLPDLNIGTNDGAACAPALRDAVVAACARQDDYSHVLDGRFKGGWTTRHYGAPRDGVHAIQMELSQINYLKSETPHFDYDDDAAAKLKIVLADIFSELQRTIDQDIMTEAARV